jgi:hypothetical protein
MKKRKSGTKHQILLYSMGIDRIWKPIFPIGIFGFAWVFLWGKELPEIGLIPAVPAPYDILVILISGFSLVFSVFTILLRKRAYIQAKDDHIFVRSPFLSFKISYRRIVRVYPGKISQLFPQAKLRGLQKKLLPSIYGETAVVLELKGYPISPKLISHLIGDYLLPPTTQGLVFFVTDWIGLSTEIDTNQSTWKLNYSKKQTAPI